MELKLIQIDTNSVNFCMISWNWLEWLAFTIQLPGDKHESFLKYLWVLNEAISDLVSDVVSNIVNVALRVVVHIIMQGNIALFVATIVTASVDAWEVDLWSFVRDEVKFVL